MKKRLFKLLVVLLLTFSLGGTAFAGNFFAGVQGGTLGIGADAGYQLFNWLKFRLNANYLPIDFRGKIEDVKYDVDIKNLTAGALLDIHPFSGKFRISAGCYYTDFDVSLKGRLYDTVKIGGHEYNASDVGKLHGDISWNKWAPYLGIGWGTNAGSSSDFSFDLSLGVMHLSGTEIDYRADGPIATVVNHPDYQDFKKDMDKEVKDIEDKIDRYSWFPVITLGFTYKF